MVRVRSGKIAVVLAAALAAWLGPLGCEPYPRPPYQAWQYAPPPAWGPQTPAPPPGTMGPAHLGDVEELIWRFTNEVRRQSGLAPLGQEGTLCGVSQAYCDDMLRRGFFSHTNPEGLTAGDRLRPFYYGQISGWGENIWEGSNLSASDRQALARRIMDAWMSSPGHRQNILGPDFTHLGVGVAASGRELRATQLFANLRPR